MSNPRPTTIAARFFVLVFGFSAAWFSLSTGIQLALEYRNTRAEVDADLQDLFTTTQAGLESALWNFDLGVVTQSLEATRSVRLLSGAMVQEETGEVLASWGEVSVLRNGRGVQNVDSWSQALYHRFPLYHHGQNGVAVPLGSVILVSGLDILAERLANGLRLILSNYAASMVGLLVILVVGLRRVVSRPLGLVTRAIGAYRFDRDTLEPLVLPGRPDELSVLWKSFDSLTSTLKESWLQQRVLSAILEEAAVMALVCDGDGRIVSSNAQARLRLGASQTGESLSQLAYGAHSGPLIPGVAALLSAGRAWRGEVTVPGEEGQTYWLSAALLPLEVPDEPRARWGVMIEDVSARRLTDRYRRERDLAQEAAHARSLFLANLSHEIRTPMNAVVGLTALALGEEISPRVRGYLGPLQQSAKALLGVINDILDFSKLEEGKMQLEQVDFRLDALLADVDAMARYRAEEKGLSLVFHPIEPAVPRLKGDPLRLQQVLLNLVSNAIKFTSSGLVEIFVREKPGTRGWWRFEVKDSGIGISAADQGRLFQSFTQLDPSNTRVYGGTGLGLSIVRQLVELMQGRFGVESREGEGSLFWVEVELGRAESGAEVGKPAWTGLEGLRVLLAEDNKVNQLVAREILAKMGITPVVVGNGGQAVEAVASGTFDLVLMDVQMPQMDGLEATRQIRALYPALRLPILAMTAHAFLQERNSCLAAGMQDVIPKPVDPDDLFDTLIRWSRAASS